MNNYNKLDVQSAHPLKPNNMTVIKRRAYFKPQCSIVCTEMEPLLVNASGNAGTISAGTTTGDAKRHFGWDDEDETPGVPSWASETNN
jgi:hypothetical protein